MSIYPEWIGEAGGTGGYVLIDELAAHLLDEEITADLDLDPIEAALLDDEIRVDLGDAP